MHKWLNITISLLLAGITAGFGVAGEVALDKEFGNDGLVITKLGFRVDEATSIAVQDDGKIVVAGSSDNGLGDKMAVLRYLPAGTVDHDFIFSAGGSLGTVHVDDAVHAVTFTDDGLILLGGTLTVAGYRQGAVLRLLPDGQLDLNFGVNGIVYLAVGDIDSEIRDMVVDSDGRIVVVGFVDENDEEKPLIARMNEQGEPDLSFGADGVFIDQHVMGRGTGLVELADSRLVIGGYSVKDDGWQGIYLGRFLENGEPDTQFGDDGRVVWFDDIEQLTIHDIAGVDEKIILAGEAELPGEQYRIMLARFGGDGQADQSFADNGVLVYDIDVDSRVYSLVVDRDSTIIAAGYQSSSAGKDLVIIRYQPVIDTERVEQAVEENVVTGEPGEEPVEIIKISKLSIEDGPMDLSVSDPPPLMFEADLITTEVEGSDEVGNDIVMTDDGSIYTAGSSGDDDNSGFLVAKYSGLVGDGYPVGSTGATVTQFYSIGTMPVIGVTRVSATTGGNIVFNDDFEEVECIEDCQEVCIDTDDSTTCISECELDCQVLTVSTRGVVYSIEPNPVYDDGTSDGDDEGETLPTDNDDSDGDDSSGLDSFFNFDGYLVREGQTDDGEGEGEYVSEIEDVNPQTIYYVRAYGVLSDGSVIYGNEYRFKTNDSCFIATAAFGSIDMFAVKALRDFRDQYLMPYEWGQMIVRSYYYLSPSIADLIDQSLLLRILVIVLLTPLVGVVLLLLYTTVLMKVFILATPVFWYGITTIRKGYGIAHE